MLGQMQLNVLRRLRVEGVIREKLHLAVNGLLTEGYANQDDGYTLTQKGAAVIYLYDELTDNERELLMRMYRAYMEKRVFSRIEDTAKVADGLIDIGLVEGSLSALTLSEYALDAWKGWREFWDMKHKRHEETRRNKIRALSPTSSNGTLPLPHELPNTVNAEIPPPVSACPDCDECSYREVLELIAQKYPKVGELRDAILAQKKLMNELGIQPK
jgi:hypothetical protein